MNKRHSGTSLRCVGSCSRRQGWGRAIGGEVAGSSSVLTANRPFMGYLQGRVLWRRECFRHKAGTLCISPTLLDGTPSVESDNRLLASETRGPVPSPHIINWGATHWKLARWQCPCTND